MKIILFASALALSTAAIAQDATAPATPPADATAPAAPMTPDATTPPTAPATPDATAPAAAPDATAAPDASAPAAAPDASAAPMTGDSSGNMAGAQQAASSVDDSNLPMCSKTVTDKCKQGGGHRGHRMMHHKKK